MSRTDFLNIDLETLVYIPTMTIC